MRSELSRLKLGTSYLMLLIPLQLSTRQSTAFYWPSIRRTTPSCNAVSRTVLFSDADSSSEGGPGDDSFDIESARERLQSLVGDVGDVSGPTDGNFEVKQLLTLPTLDDDDMAKHLPPPPPLSTIERDRRMVEMQYLERLKKGDDDERVTAALWDLWYSERGGQALQRLKVADKLMNDPSSWKACETTLLDLINEHSVYFVEPVNRLATLYFLQGKLDESYKLCQIILKLKPWHFGALSGIVQVCIRKGDREDARLRAAKRLPSSVAGSSFPPFEAKNGPENPQRAEWVEEMVNSAKELLKEAERVTQERLGEPEEYYEGDSQSTMDADDDAWQ